MAKKKKPKFTTSSLKKAMKGLMKKAVKDKKLRKRLSAPETAKQEVAKLLDLPDNWDEYKISFGDLGDQAGFHFHGGLTDADAFEVVGRWVTATCKSCRNCKEE